MGCLGSHFHQKAFSAEWTSPNMSLSPTLKPPISRMRKTLQFGNLCSLQCYIICYLALPSLSQKGCCSLFPMWGCIVQPQGDNDTQIPWGVVYCLKSFCGCQLSPWSHSRWNIYQLHVFSQFLSMEIHWWMIERYAHVPSHESRPCWLIAAFATARKRSRKQRERAVIILFFCHYHQHSSRDWD